MVGGEKTRLGFGDHDSMGNDGGSRRIGGSGIRIVSLICCSSFADKNVKAI